VTGIAAEEAAVHLMVVFLRFADGVMTVREFSEVQLVLCIRQIITVGVHLVVAVRLSLLVYAIFGHGDRVEGWREKSFAMYVAVGAAWLR
jgi:hypothetical protein